MNDVVNETQMPKESLEKELIELLQNPKIVEEIVKAITTYPNHHRLTNFIEDTISSLPDPQQTK